jgi:hypothetical protein
MRYVLNEKLLILNKSLDFAVLLIFFFINLTLCSDIDREIVYGVCMQHQPSYPPHTQHRTERKEHNTLLLMLIFDLYFCRECVNI